MKRNYPLSAIRYSLFLLGLFLISGCVVRTYPLTRERIDQDLNVGNRGFLKGQATTGETKERKATRTTQIVEIELHPPIKFEKMPKAQDYEPKVTEKVSVERVEDKATMGNKGYITGGGVKQPRPPSKPLAVAPLPNIEKYTVQKGDTLQKISQKFYGTTKKWNELYEANKAQLKGPNKIYPGQVIEIPLEPLKETKKNLK